jgi:hypothetical protein
LSFSVQILVRALCANMLCTADKGKQEHDVVGEYDNLAGLGFHGQSTRDALAPVVVKRRYGIVKKDGGLVRGRA